MSGTWCRYDLADLPLALIQNIVARLDYKDVARLGHTCSFFRALAEDATPGLLLSLYPHQARFFVTHRLVTERAASVLWRRVPATSRIPSCPAWVDTVDGPG